MNVWSFLGGIMPVLLQFGSDLFRRYRGDVSKASAHIQRMRDHGAAFDEADERNRAELEQLKALEDEDTKREKPSKGS